MASSKERERELARQRYERRRQRQDQRRQRARQTGIVVGTGVAVVAVIAVVAVLFATVGHHDHKPAATSPTTTAAPTSTSSGGATPAAGACTYSKAGSAAKDVGQPPATPARQVVGARITLGQGTLDTTLDGKKAPCTVNSFTYLAGKGYFNGVPCHRLTTQGIFVLQCGDPTGTGSGGPGYQFGDENLTAFGGQAGAQTTYPAGTLAMANAGPGTNGSQFFIVYKDSPLAASYTPFGKVTKGLDVVRKIAALGTADGAPDGKPKKPVQISGVTVLQ